MIGPVSVKVSASHPNFPLRAVPVFQGSACSIGVECVPAYFGGVSVTGVSVSVETPDGETSTVAAKRSGCMWVATFGAEAFSVPGSVRNGITVTAHGIEEDGETSASWTLGKGDLDVISADGVPVPGEVWQNVHLRDSVPSSPVKGDLAKFGSAWKIYTGSAWESFGGGGGGGSVVESPTNPGYAANADAAKSVPWSGVSGRPTSFDPSAHASTHWKDGSDPITPESIGALPQVGGDVGTEETPGSLFLRATYLAAPSITLAQSFADAGSVSVPDSAMYQQTGEGPRASITKGGKEVATEEQLAVVMDLVEVSGGYEIRLNGTKLTYAVVKEAALTRHAIIRHGQGTYRPTYVGTNEMMWDCTGTVQGEVKTGQIHMFRSGNVVQLVPAKVLAPAEFAAYPMVDISGSQALDRTINIFPAPTSLVPYVFAVVFPARTGSNARDFVVRAKSYVTAPTVMFPADVNYESDQDDCWTAESGKANEWYFSESEPGLFKVVHKAFVQAVQPQP